MAGELLLDTGALVSLLDRTQTHHEACAAYYDGWAGPVVSTEAVLTVATHLLAQAAGGREACLDFFLAGGATLVPSDAASLRRCRELVHRYRDLPMDFADATLVTLAQELGTRKVFTIDRDFEVYRFRRRSRFELVPDVPRRRWRR
ncbi:MAG: type II toxin-antitoxin system VapC family toxin [Planctomycetota bacterium]